MAKQLSPEQRKALSKAPNPNGGGGSDLFFGKTDINKAKKVTIRLLPCNLATDIKQVDERWIDSKPFIGPGVTHGKPCLFDAVYRRLMAAQSEKAKAIAEKLKPGVSYWIKAVVRDNDGGGTVKVVKLPKDCYKAVYEVIDTDDTDISDLEAGMDVRLSSNGEAGMTASTWVAVL